MARNSIATNLLMIVLLGGGLFTMYHIQKEVFPEFQLDFVEVSVVYPGASPAEVEQGVLQPVEEAVRAVQGIKEIVSEAREGSAEISIELVICMFTKYGEHQRDSLKLLTKISLNFVILGGNHQIW